MTKKKLRQVIAVHMVQEGFGAGTYRFTDTGIVVLIGGELVDFEFRARMPIRDLRFEMGRISGFAQKIGRKPREWVPQLNGAAHQEQMPLFQ